MDMKRKTYAFRDRMAILTIPGPLKHEDDFHEVSYQISDFCEEVMSDQDIRVAVITDDPGGALCIQRAPVTHMTEGGETIAGMVPSLCEPISRLEVPVLAALCGDAMGLGLELILACDLRIAAETSRFALPQISEGLIPGDGGTQRLSRLVGRGKAMEIILTGRPVDAHEAYRTGLVNRLVPRGEVMGEAEKMAKEMASKGPIALRYIKEAITKGMDMTLEQGLRLEADLYLLIHSTKDRTEGIRAFQDKRPADFKGE